MNIVVSNPKDGKAYTVKAENAHGFIGKKIGAEVKLDAIGLAGYEAVITGGSDKQGFPMKRDLPGTTRRKIFIVTDKKGTRKRITRRGNTITDEIAQVNVKITKEGAKKLNEILGKKEEASEEKEEVKAEEKKEAPAKEEKKEEKKETEEKQKKEETSEEKSEKPKEKEKKE
jgi:small subunit ribosomal protein S6e